MPDNSKSPQSEINVSNIVTEINYKLDADLGNLSEKLSDNMGGFIDKYLEDSFTIIYPNGGSKKSPANVSIGTAYLALNPFPGYRVNCCAELLYNNEWGRADTSYWSTGPTTAGICVYQHDDDNLVIITGTNSLIYANYRIKIRHSWPYQITITQKTLPCRVKVWKIGKI